MEDLQGFHPSLVRQGIFKGVNLVALAERFWRLEAMRTDVREKLPAIRWRAYSRGKAWGIAYTGFSQVIVRLGPTCAIEEAAETLLHELVHCACPINECHGELFCRRLVACAREAFGLPIDTATMLALPTKQGCRAYSIDDAIVSAMKIMKVGEKLKGDGRFEAPLPETEEAKVARLSTARAERAREREQHCRKMLLVWEKRAEKAKRQAAKWHAKVRYYDRRALMGAVQEVATQEVQQAAKPRST
jgi:hypothetical protein